VTVCGHHFPDKAWQVCCSCCTGMCTRGDTVFWYFLDWLFCWVCERHCLHPLTAGIYCCPLQNFSLQHVLLLLCPIPVPHMSAVFPLHVRCLPHVWCYCMVVFLLCLVVLCFCLMSHQIMHCSLTSRQVSNSRYLLRKKVKSCLKKSENGWKKPNS